MNPFVFELSGYTLKTFSGFSKASIQIKGRENIPEGAVIFCANHFTRIETIFLPYHIYSITGKQAWSLAAKELFDIPVLEGLMKRLGGLSTHDPLRNEKILTSLLSGKVHWIIFPEGMMVKNKKLIRNNEFTLIDDEKQKRPHTGAAVQALRCEFFRERLRRLSRSGAPEFERLATRLGIEDVNQVLAGQTHIVPVNISYYPANPRENILGSIANVLMKEPSKRMLDELMTEGGMLFAGVDITIRFGAPIPINPFLNDPYIESMLTVKRRVRFDEDIYSKEVCRGISNRIMERYMADVYAMTTLNYDHVMACILKHFPYQKKGIDIYEFKCKVYYAVTCLVLNRICYVSDIFKYNLIPLLINDRFDRIGRFLALAEDTGVVRIEGKRMFKDQTRFYKNSPFHSVRLENPVLVMANEVEPITEAEICLKKIAQKSKRQILERVRSRLIEKMNVDFSLAYSRFYIDGESKSKRVGRPLFLKQANEIAGILLIHGYMAAPREMKAFATYLYEKGFTVYAPRLAGHGTAPEDLAGTGYEDWVESVEEAYVVLRHSCKKIIIGGFSTGAGLALELAGRVDDYEAIFAVAPPMRLNDMGSYFVPAIDAWNAMVKKLRLDAGAKEFIENNPENPHINYVRNPIAGVNQLGKLMDQLAPKLREIEKPVLVVQSRKDPVVNPKGTLKLFKKIGAEIKEYYLFDFERHGILLGKGKHRVFQAVENFIRQWV
ncbi:MAG: alpha/beta fold hydrolase [Desulfobacterales bacterium]|nr:alpha/beta fold hydrolase [Desulfobacterales bacterium]